MHSKNTSENFAGECGCDGCSTKSIGHKTTDFSRRGFLCAVAGTAAVLAGATASSIRPALAQSNLTPDQALRS
jgi:hypothetical protein